MVLGIFLYKLKSIISFIVAMVKKSMCCFRRRRKSDVDSVPLTTIGIIPNYQPVETKEECMIKWEEWGTTGVTVQERIQEYRRHQSKPEIPEEPPPDYFQDMIPEIRRQARMFIKTQDTTSNPASRFTVASDTVIPTEIGELGSWEDRSNEKTAWVEAENWNMNSILREKRREDRQARRPPIGIKQS